MRRRDAAQNRLADRGVAAEAAAQDNVERFEWLAVGPARGRPLQPDVTGPMLRARMRASIEIQLEPRDLVAEVIDQPLDDSGELGLGRRDRIVAMWIADASDRRRVESIRIERETNLADFRDDAIETILRNSSEDE